MPNLRVVLPKEGVVPLYFEGIGVLLLTDTDINVPSDGSIPKHACKAITELSQ